ncbi:MAG: class I SAM-dependent methyltransferase [Planctomycetes bacterium]|nr:class I SAM-dependent methyltransferase [Planctomycetota bacterium]
MSGDVPAKPSADQAQRALWDHYEGQDPAVFAGSTYRLGWLACQLAPGTAVLDIGIGDGTFARLALARGLTPFGLDPSPAAVARMAALVPGGERAKVGSCADIPWPAATFDAVVMSEVLEHLEPDTLAACLREVRRVLRPGGRFLGTVPAREDLAASMVFCPHCRETFHRWGHHQSFDVVGLRARLAPEFPRGTVAERQFIVWNQLNWKGRILACARLLLQCVGSPGRTSTIVFDMVASGRTADP